MEAFCIDCGVFMSIPGNVDPGSVVEGHPHAKRVGVRRLRVIEVAMFTRGTLVHPRAMVCHDNSEVGDE
jgi:hypothetical protein